VTRRLAGATAVIGVVAVVVAVAALSIWWRFDSDIKQPVHAERKAAR